jgi:hypothetical protein
VQIARVNIFDIVFVLVCRYGYTTAAHTCTGDVNLERKERLQYCFCSMLGDVVVLVLFARHGWSFYAGARRAGLLGQHHGNSQQPSHPNH